MYQRNKDIEIQLKDKSIDGTPQGDELTTLLFQITTVGAVGKLNALPLKTRQRNNTINTVSNKYTEKYEKYTIH